VLERNANWLRERITPILSERYPDEIQFFATGGSEGRTLSSRDVRQRSKEISESLGLSETESRKLAETGLGLDAIANIRKQGKDIYSIYRLWELGTVFYDMLVASRHASHVVRSVKNLAARGSRRDYRVNVNESIQEALTILSSPLRKVEVNLDLSDVPSMPANKGELVQVWMNLIKNATEAMLKARTEKPALHIRSYARKNSICVEVEDNGPGIPKSNLERIFQPDFTTKESGLEFGLGLGLSIVERIVDSYGGGVSVKSKPGKTTFVVKIKAA
jgi:signal transduction histidine kinase